MQQPALPLPAPGRVRKFTPIAMFVVGLGITGSFLTVLALPQFRDSLAYRYFRGHPIEEWTTWLFFWGMTALVWKLWGLRAQRRALSRRVLAVLDGRTVALAEIPRLQQLLAQLPAGLRGTWLVQRLADALSYVQHHGSADGLEERLQVLADRDANELDGSYELVRTVTWAVPILGFLGTVVGITIAIANIMPDQLEESLNEVVGGLAVAFDTTALSLALAMVLVLTKFLVERAEQAVLARVDTSVEDLLLHRFERLDAETRKFLTAVEGVAEVILHSTRDAWREQGQLWTKAIEQIGTSHVTALGQAARTVVEQTGQIARQIAADQLYQFSDLLKRLEKVQEAAAATVTVLREAARESIDMARQEAHQNAVKQDTQFQHFLTGLESLRNVCQKSLADVAAKMTAHQAAAKRQIELIAQLVADEGRLTKLQHTLKANLATLANVQSLDEAVHSLSAAVHLLTGRAGRVDRGPWLSASGDLSAEEAA